MPAIRLDPETMRRNRHPGWRGWFDDREGLLRLIGGRKAPPLVVLIWHVQFFLTVRRRQLVCLLVGHRRVDHRRFGPMCLRCGSDL